MVRHWGVAVQGMGAAGKTKGRLRLRWPVGGAAVLAVLLWWCYRDPQPYYHGRALSYWLAAYEEANRHFPTDPKPAEAIHGLGSEAAPYLLTWFRYRHPVWQEKLVVRLETMPVSLRTPCTNASGLIRARWARNDARRYGALWCFGVLGADARSALPELGARAMLNNQDGLEAVRALQEMGTNAEPVLARFMVSLSNGDTQTACLAARNLGLLRLRPDLVLPAFSEHITDTRPKVRIAILRALPNFGKEAEDLAFSAHKDQEESVRAESLKVVSEIRFSMH